MTFILILNLIFLSTSYSFSQENICQNKIVFIPQQHLIQTFTGVIPTLEDKRKTAESQIAIYHYLKSLKDPILFSENAGAFDIDSSIINKDKAQHILKQFQLTFSDGIPKESNQLTHEQIEFLYKYSADLILFLQNNLSKLHRVIKDPFTENQIFKPIENWFKKRKSSTNPYPPEIAKLVYEEREQQALQQVSSYFSNKPQQKVVYLIYGSNHNFSFYKELFPPECIIVPDEFKDKWNGSNRTSSIGFKPSQIHTGITMKNDSKVDQ